MANLTVSSDIDALMGLSRFAAMSEGETRPLKVYKVEPFISSTGQESGAYLPSGSGNTVTLFTDSSGAGSVHSIQLAIAGASTNPTFLDSTLEITVDSTLVASVPVGLFFLTYGSATVFNTSRFALTLADYTGRNMGGYRKIYIPYTANCTIALKNAGTGQPDIFAQVEYRQGAPLAYGSRRVKFHAAVLPFTSKAAFASFSPLSSISGTGILDSLQVFAFGSGVSNGNRWMEGNPSIVIDGSSATWGGTEDFFGYQYYGIGFTNGTPRCNERCGIPQNATGDPYYAALFRFFDEPITFDSSLAITMYNGQANQGGGSPPTLSFASLAIYYTTN